MAASSVRTSSKLAIFVMMLSPCDMFLATTSRPVPSWCCQVDGPAGAVHRGRAMFRGIDERPVGPRGGQVASLLQQAAAMGEVPELGQAEAAQRTEAEVAARRSAQLNLACNDVVRTVLDGNVTSERERALALRQRLEAQREELVVPEDDMSSVFFENLLLVCEHQLHPDVDLLSGQYGKAWKTILHYIEDAGWQLTDPPFSVTG